MAKRKLLSRSRVEKNKEEVLSSSEDEVVNIVPKRFKNKNGQASVTKYNLKTRYRNVRSELQNVDDSDCQLESTMIHNEEDLQVKEESGEDVQIIPNIENGVHSDEDLNLELLFQQNRDESNASGGNYQGFESFMKAFHFISDNDDSDNDSNNAGGNDEVQEVNAESTEEKAVEEDNNATESFMDTTGQDLSQISEILPDVIEKCRAMNHHLQNREILFLKHPMTVPLMGYLKVKLLAGKASILGSDLVLKKSVTVFSQKQTGLLSIETHAFNRLDDSLKHNLRKTLRGLLPGVDKKDFRKNFKRNFGPNTVVVALEEIQLPNALQFVELYYPLSASVKKIDRTKESFYTSFLQNAKVVIDLPKEYEEIYTKIEHHLRKLNKRRPAGYKVVVASESDTTASEDEEAMEIHVNVSGAQMDESLTPCDSPMPDETEDSPSTRIEAPTPNETKAPAANATATTAPPNVTGACILIQGSKKTGKSVMLRYLINKFLNSYKEVYYLDTDPGQTEFTPPGVVSLTRVTEPIFGPPYAHLREPLEMIFIGSCTAETAPPMYLRSVLHLIKHFRAKYPNSILLVNTMGWITGLGDIMLQVIKKAAEAAVEIELQPELQDLEWEKTGQGKLRLKVGFGRDSATSTKKGEFRPADLRDWALLSYFGQCQAYYLQPSLLNAIQPYCVKWDDLYIYHFDKRTPLLRVYESIHCNVVALCQVEKSYLLVSKDKKYPNTLDNEPHNKCLGFGIVRSVDEEKHLLYIITPLQLNVLKNVNALIAGNILIPNSVILNQPILHQPFNYTDDSREGPTEARKKVQRRTRYNCSTLA